MTKRLDVLSARSSTPDRLTELLAERLLGWRVTPDRFLTGNRGWRPRWRFQPLEHFADAAMVLEAAAPDEHEIRTDRCGVCCS